MDIDKALAHFVDKEQLIQHIRDLPSDAAGVAVFTHSAEELDEDGDDVEICSCYSYGGIGSANAVWILMNAIDQIRGH